MHLFRTHPCLVNSRMRLLLLVINLIFKCCKFTLIPLKIGYALGNLGIELSSLSLKFTLLLFGISLAFDELVIELLLKHVDLEVMLLSQHLFIKKGFLLLDQRIELGSFYLPDSELPRNVIQAFVQKE
jgi:hypothetical protein